MQQLLKKNNVMKFLEKNISAGDKETHFVTHICEKKHQINLIC